MSGPGPSEAAASIENPAPEPSSNAEASPPDATSASPGAEAAAVLGGSFSAIYSIARREDKIIEELQKRSHSRPGAPTRDTREDTRGPYRATGTPMVITTEAFASQGRYLVFWSGPSNTQWKFELRAAQEATRSGTIYHYWRNSSRATMFDEPSVTFTFQSGNIMPVRFRNLKDDPDTIFLPPGLLDYYDFFDMLNQPKILPDGRPNFVFISYHSLVYPEIFLRGFFDPSGIQITESAENPTDISWSATFKIRSTEPPFWSSAQLVSSWNSAMSSQDSPELAAQELELTTQEVITSAATEASINLAIDAVNNLNPPVTGQGPQG